MSSRSRFGPALSGSGRILVGMIILGLLCNGLASSPAPASDDEPLSDWVPWSLVASAVVGGVLYIIERNRAPQVSELTPLQRTRNLISDFATWGELGELNTLQDEAEIDAFLQGVFARRDPTPSTPENEFKDEHLRRYEAASKLFREPGSRWNSDRRRIYMVHGPPLAIHRYEVKDPYDLRLAWKTAEVWEYDERAGSTPLPPVLSDPRLFDAIFRDVGPITGTKLFMFVNESGEGFSRLAFSTEPEEPFDRSIYNLVDSIR